MFSQKWQYGMTLSESESSDRNVFDHEDKVVGTERLQKLNTELASAHSCININVLFDLFDLYNVFNN